MSLARLTKKARAAILKVPFPESGSSFNRIKAERIWSGASHRWHPGEGCDRCRKSGLECCAALIEGQPRSRYCAFCRCKNRGRCNVAQFAGYAVVRSARGIRSCSYHFSHCLGLLLTLLLSLAPANKASRGSKPALSSLQAGFEDKQRTLRSRNKKKCDSQVHDSSSEVDSQCEARTSFIARLPIGRKAAQKFE